jgi:hypothetical protein
MKRKKSNFINFPNNITFKKNKKSEMERVEIKHDLTEEEVTWKSCCLRTDRQAVVYLGQLSFSLSVMGVCTTMLILADGDCNKSSPYISLIAFLLGKLLSQVVDSTHR